MQRIMAAFFGFLALGLGVIGLMAGDKQLLNLMNIDMALDIGRIGLAALLLYAVYMGRDMGLVRSALLIFSMVYIVMGVVGLFDKSVFGLLPHHLTVFDVFFHLAAGGIALYAAAEESNTRMANSA